jgi:demethylmenaquinone methyltransferase/2-methoxy-6-polyprenyl-1,4-benzoquinol methylase
VGFFNWAAPIFGHVADRWDDAGIEQIAGWLSPFLPNGDAESPARLLDVGGGTGALARRLHDALGASVTVLDPTPEMLGYIPIDGPVRAVLGTAEAMPFPADAFDAVIVTDAFHHFRDQPGAVAEFARVVRTGGGVVVVDLDPTGLAMRVIALAEKALGEPGAFFTPEQMCAFMAEQGIEGSCTRERGATYRFVGKVD